MVNAIGSAAQQISSNLSKLKENSSAGTQNSDTDSMKENSGNSAEGSRGAAGRYTASTCARRAAAASRVWRWRAVSERGWPAE